jgi:transposase-like protein
MGRPSKFSPEVRERAVRMVLGRAAEKLIHATLGK